MWPKKINIEATQTQQANAPVDTGNRVQGLLERQRLRYGRGILPAMDNPGLDVYEPVNVPDVVNDYETETIPTQTGFFRELSLVEFTESIAGTYQKKLGRPLRIADVACSDARETWSLAAALKGNGVDAQIDGFDVSKMELAVARAGGPYTGLISGLRLDLHIDYGHPERAQYLSYLHQSIEASRTDSPEIRPDESIRNMASFYELDIASRQLEPGYDVVACYNMLWHYDQKTREQILGNMLSGLRPEGVFMFEGPSGGRDANSSQTYRKWTENLSRFGLSRHPNIDANNGWPGSIRIYNPVQAENSN